MKKILIFICLIMSLFSKQNVYADENIFARSYVVMEQNSGKLLESKDCNLQRSVASVSKIMTAIIALESEDLFKSVVVGNEIDQVVGSSLYLEKGCKINIIELVYGLLLRSGNDAAVIIATNIGGSVDEFVRKMNEKARDIGMKNTHFSNPSGLDMFDDGNISTSYDLALLMQYCMQNKTFREINATKHYKSSLKGSWANKHKLIQNYEYAIGGKTGYTKKAKRTLITSARKEEMELIVVTLDCGSDFSFHKNKFEKYFNEYAYIKFLDIGKNNILNYEFYSDIAIGVLEKNSEIDNIIKVYKVNPHTKELSMYLNYKDGRNVLVGKIVLQANMVQIS